MSPSPSKLAAAVALGLLSLSAPARAEIPNPAFYIGVWGGGNLVIADWNLGNKDYRKGANPNPFGPNPTSPTPSSLLPTHSAILGGRLGFQFTSIFALEAALGYLPLPSTAGGSNQALAYDLNLLFHFFKAYNWTPTVEIGVGGYTNLSGDLGPDTDPKLHIGLGVRGMLTRWLALRVNLRDVLSDGFSPSGSNNLEITAGLDFFVWRGKWKHDRDGDGIEDSVDACPDVKGISKFKGCPDTDGDGVPDNEDKCPSVAGSPEAKGCPDADHDGVPDGEDQCPDRPATAAPDPNRPGCPIGAVAAKVAADDRDKDGVPDDKDLCPDVPAGSVPSLDKPGCPSDRDGDGVVDIEDSCVDEAAGKFPDPQRKGCPADTDKDGVLDEKDQCIDVPAGNVPDAARPGCPADKDGDSVPDAVDACPDKAGAPDPDPKKNGCPGLARIENGQIVILNQVYFATGKNVILPKSFPVLTAVVNAIKSLPPGRKISVEGHTDDKGKPAANLALSQARATAVEKWLVAKGIDDARIDSKGFGSTRPLVPNKNEAARAKNRRVEFHIN